MAFRTNKMPVLQEKSASGAVATFNTALAMPLVNGEFSIVAYQEGSGDPSPVNVRNIVPRREVNIYQRGINLWDEEWEKGYINSSGGNGTDANSIRSKNFCVCVPSIKYCFLAPKTSYVHFYDRNKNWIERKPASANVATVIIAPSNAYYFRLSSYGYGSTYNDDITFNYPSTDTEYHAYNGNIYTKQLGETVYGGSYNSVSGVKSKTQDKVDLGSLNWVSSEGFHYAIINNGIYGTNLKAANAICDHYKIVRGQDFASTNNAFCYGLNNRPQLWVNDSNLNSLSASDFKTAMSNIYVRYELATPIESNIGATPISTNIGINTIFADTGDIDLTYKDLDIAKRGNFREVFKLPS